MENTSGQGSAATIPEQIRGWSWGAFIFTWLWGLFNRTWIALATLIPVIGIVVWILCGLKGNEWAWRNKRWDDVEHFKRVQRKWALAGLVMVLLVVASGAAAVLLGISLSSLVDEAEVSAQSKAAPVTPSPAPAAKAPPPAAAKAPVEAAAAPAPAPAAAPAVTPPAAVQTPAAPEAPAEAAKAPSSREAAARKTPRDASGDKAAPVPPAAAAAAPATAPWGMASAPVVVTEVARPTPTKPSPPFNDLMSAVVMGGESDVRETIAFGKFVDQRDSNGFTPLMVAAMRRQAGMARLLLESGANPRLVGAGGQSAMRFARDNDDAGMVVLLRSYGVPER